MTETKFKLLNKNFLLVMLAAAGVSFGAAIFVSTIPVYTEKISGSSYWAGAMTAIFSFAALLARPISGYYIDRINRGIVAFIGALLCLIGCLLYNVAGVIAVLVLVRALHGFGFGLGTTASNTIAVDMIPYSRRVEGLGIYGLSMTIPQAVAPAIGLPMISKPNGMLHLTLISGALLIVTLVAFVLIKYPKHEGLHKETHVSEDGKSEKLGKYLVKSIPMSIMVMVFSIVQGAVLSFIAIYAFDIGYASIGLFFTFSAAGMVIARLFAGKLGDKYGVRFIMIPSFIIFFLSILGVTYAFNEVFMIAMGLPYGLALGSIIPGFNVQMLHLFPDSRRGFANSLYFICIDLGIGGGSMAWGAVANYIGYKGIFVASTALCAIIIVAYILIKEKKDNEPAAA